MTWVSMLLFVQLVQIMKAQTTWENMRGSHHEHASKASEAITSALTSGALTAEGAQLGNDGLGPDPALPPTHAPTTHRHTGCLDQWKKLLGVDAFMGTVQTYKDGKVRGRRNQNPFSRGKSLTIETHYYQTLTARKGIVTNCKDFWCDPAPVFGRRENGAAMLGGNLVNYTMMYETPTMKANLSRDAMAYERVATHETETV